MKLLPYSDFSESVNVPRLVVIHIQQFLSLGDQPGSSPLVELQILLHSF